MTERERLIREATVPVRDTGDRGLLRLPEPGGSFCDELRTWLDIYASAEVARRSAEQDRLAAEFLALIADMPPELYARNITRAHWAEVVDPTSPGLPAPGLACSWHPAVSR